MEDVIYLQDIVVEEVDCVFVYFGLFLLKTYRLKTLGLTKEVQVIHREDVTLYTLGMTSVRRPKRKRRKKMGLFKVPEVVTITRV